jgi:hypothetical protein
VLGREAVLKGRDDAWHRGGRDLAVGVVEDGGRRRRSVSGGEVGGGKSLFCGSIQN